ncbi:Di-copper centre-containing protein [Dacryopinax primogenitus]|uniref:Di-copper centre-containing protein n=1 Tax=Dacryopinax primogenitus (strain DJM 731) TaxID=1858805 RepID=M5FVC3_DACPD|nr:Di-copper centre-containing protein [Dacryopinax primogenitus]EJT97271.1 Di-copper centre-containing protein [Dacryopinax primogenitus]
MGRPLILLCVVALLTGTHLACANGEDVAPRKCDKLLSRREWRTLTLNERAEWIRAVKCLGNIRHPRLSFTPDQTVLHGDHSLYDDFSYAHAVMDSTAHFKPYFLPWHRWFLHLFDSKLRSTCAYTGPTPFWDWSQDHADLFHSPVFDPDPEHGLGGTGDCDSFSEADCVVTTGAFAPSPSSDTGDFTLAWPLPHHLRRNLTLLTGWFEDEQPQNSTLGPSFVQNATLHTTGDFWKFQWYMTLMHNHVHNLVGGDMAGDCPRDLPREDCRGMAIAYTPNDPLFWLHHAQLDRLWSEWQVVDPLNFDAFSGLPLNPTNLSNPHYSPNASTTHLMEFDRLSVSVPVSSMFDHEQWPLCYQYAEML